MADELERWRRLQIEQGNIFWDIYTSSTLPVTHNIPLLTRTLSIELYPSDIMLHSFDMWIAAGVSQIHKYTTQVIDKRLLKY